MEYLDSDEEQADDYGLRSAALYFASTVRSSGMRSPRRHTTPCSPKRAFATSDTGMLKVTMGD